MAKAKDLTGRKFGLLTAIRRVENRGRLVSWLCKCDCGNECVVAASYLRWGTKKSCGCSTSEMKRKAKTVHGGDGTRLYRTWMSMKRRCDTPSVKDYQNYGGRGISVCEEWLHDFAAFRDWAIRSGYTDELTLDRIDPNGNYEPSNCRWANRKQQSNNRRSNHLETFNGETHNVSEWAQIAGMNMGTLKSRLQRGWSIERALTTPTK